LLSFYILFLSRTHVKIKPRSEIFKQNLPEVNASIENLEGIVESLFNACHQMKSKKSAARINYLSNLLAQLKQIKQDLKKL